MTEYDIMERLRQRAYSEQPLCNEAADEIERLRERLGPRGLEVVMIDGAGHYVNEAVKAEIERLRASLDAATRVALMHHQTIWELGDEIERLNAIAERGGGKS